MTMLDETNIRTLELPESDPDLPVEFWPAPDCPECGNVETRWLARPDADAWSCGDCGLEFEIGDPQ